MHLQLLIIDGLPTSSPLHAVGHSLYLFFYSNSKWITNGLYACIKRLVPNKDVQQKF